MLHTWSHLITPGHIWSLKITSGHLEHEHLLDAGGVLGSVDLVAEDGLLHEDGGDLVDVALAALHPRLAGFIKFF